MENNSFIPGLETISQKDLQKTVEYLSSPELEGRLSGSPGYFKAANFAKDKFKSLGLKPAFNDDYFQRFNVEYNNILSASLKLIKEDGSSKEYTLGKDFVCRGFTGSSNSKAGIVFCGYGISAPELGYDDYKGIDVKGNGKAATRATNLKLPTSMAQKEYFLFRTPTTKSRKVLSVVFSAARESKIKISHNCIFQ